jgi:hypothetical protein
MAFPSLQSCCGHPTRGPVNLPKSISARKVPSAGTAPGHPADMRDEAKGQKYRIPSNSIANRYHPLGTQRLSMVPRCQLCSVAATAAWRDGGGVRIGRAARCEPGARMTTKTFAETLDEAFDQINRMDASLGERLQAFADTVRKLDSSFAEAVEAEGQGRGRGCARTRRPDAKFPAARR